MYMNFLILLYFHFLYRKVAIRYTDPLEAPGRGAASADDCFLVKHCTYTQYTNLYVQSCTTYCLIALSKRRDKTSQYSGRVIARDEKIMFSI